jgi:hypothetical protein
MMILIPKTSHPFSPEIYVAGSPRSYTLLPQSKRWKIPSPTSVLKTLNRCKFPHTLTSVSGKERKKKELTSPSEKVLIEEKPIL